MSDAANDWVYSKPPTSSQARSAALPAASTDDEQWVYSKQKEEGVDFSTQTLYDMARTPEERRRALEHGYGPENVKQDASGLYVEKDGKRLTPKGSGLAKRAAAFTLAEAAPTAGAITGAVLSSPGIFTAMGGAAFGGAAGQGFNDALLGLAGIYDRSTGKELGELTSAGAFSAAGEGGGQLIGRGLAAATQGSNIFRRFAQWMTDVDQMDVAQLVENANKGLNQPPASYAPHSPMLELVRTWAARFGHDPVRDTAVPYYKKEAGRIMGALGIPETELGEITEPATKTSLEKTGETMIAAAKKKLAADDAKLNEQIAAIGSQMEAKTSAAAAAHASQLAALEKTATDARESANGLINHAWETINNIQDKMWKAAKLGTRPGDLARQYAKSIWDLRKAGMRRARKLYGAADVVAGGAKLDATDVSALAQNFLNQLPEELQKTFPAMVRTLSKMETDHLTFGEAHSLRTELRSLGDYEDLTSDFKNGLLKRMAGAVNALIHDPTNAASLQKASKLLDTADDFYSGFLARFKDQKVRSLVNQVRAGMPKNPEEIARVALDHGNGELAAELKRIVGPETWNATVAADVRAMIRNSQSLTPGEMDWGAFVSQIERRLHNGVLDLYPKDLADVLRTQARRIATVNGKLPVKALPGDTIADLVGRANAAEEQAKLLAKNDPLGTLKDEIGRMKESQKLLSSESAQQRAADRLGFLTESTVGANEAARKILSDPDNLAAALLRFDADSPEIALLRQTAARDLLTATIDKSGIKFGGQKIQKELSEETLRRIFPGDLYQDVLKLTKNIKSLFPQGADIGSSFSAVAQVTNPLAHVPGFIKRATVGVPMFLLRAVREKVIGRLANLMTQPKTILWLTKGINGNPAERAAAKAAVARIVNSGGELGGAIGAGSGAGLKEAAETPDDPRPQAQYNRNSWRQHYNEWKRAHGIQP